MMSSKVAARFLAQQVVRHFGATAAGSSPASAASATKASSSNLVVQQRAAYREQMTELRKNWNVEIKQQQDREGQRLALEKDRLVLEKAIRLREKRKASLARQEQAKKKREEALGRYREKLARNHVVHAQRVAKQRESYQNLADTLTAESSSWITLDNMDSKITEDLFEAPATTGILTRDSKHWRYHLLTIQLKRMLSPEYVSESSASGSSLADRLQQRGQAKSVKRLMLEDFIEPMIGSGQERANYQEIIDKFAEKMEDHYVTDEELDTYIDYIMNNNADFGDEDDEEESEEAMGGDTDDEAAELAQLRAMQEEEEEEREKTQGGKGGAKGSGALEVGLDVDLDIDAAVDVDDNDGEQAADGKKKKKKDVVVGGQDQGSARGLGQPR